MSKWQKHGTESAAVRMSPLALGVRNALSRKRRAPLVATTLLASTMAFGQANTSGVLEEIVVTAQKREQNLQDVPISVTVLDQKALHDLNIKGFNDYVLYMPNVSFQAYGPGQAQIYMRGCSDGGDGNFSGTNPSTAVYLDEQPVTSIGRNLDVQIYDIARIEALGGPQGTLYGSSSQCGTIRIIANKPNTDGFEAGYDVGVNSVTDGDEGYSAKGFVNFPLSDNAAIRLVGWFEEEGGWIDVVPATATFSDSGITVENFGNSDSNLNTVEDDYNTLTSSGLRAMLGIDLNDSWTLNASVNAQSQESDGIFADQPNGASLPGGASTMPVGQGRVVRFFQDDYEDEWTQLGITLEGELGNLGTLTLAGSYLDREVQYDIDYSLYSEYSAYVEYYYTCNYTIPPYAYFTNCVDPRMQYNNDSDIEVTTLEARLQSSGDGPLNWVAGLFYQTNDHAYFNQWHIPTIDPTFGPIDSTIWNVRGETDLYFATNQVRTIDHQALFGEISYDFTDKLTALIGARFFEIDEDLSGFVGTKFASSYSECAAAGVSNNIPRNQSSPSDPPCGSGLRTNESDSTYKVNVTYQFTDDVLAYFTFSQGFRPGGINRVGTTNIPQFYNSDTVDNFELGWKATLADGRMRFNGAVYRMSWDDIQLTRFQPSESLLGLTQNAADAEMTGIEANLEWLVNDNWNVSLAAAYNKAELSENFAQDASGSPVDAPDGTELPMSPDFKYSISTRYQFNQGSWNPHVQVAWAWTGKTWNDLFVADRLEHDSYGLLDASFGVQRGNWNVEVYGSNLTDENAELFRYSRGGDDRITANRPRTWGVRFWQRFK